MNTTFSINKTFFLYECLDVYPENIITLSSVVLDLMYFVPLHIWTLYLCLREWTKGKGIAPSDILTINLSVMEIVSFFGFGFCALAVAFQSSTLMLITVFMLGKYLIGRPTINCFICVERYIAVVHPVLFHRFNTLRHRWVIALVAWLITWIYGGYVIYLFPHMPLFSYAIFLAVSLLTMTACSLGVLKALLRPSPGEKEKEGIHRQKKRAFRVITKILVQLVVSYSPLLVVQIIKTVIPYRTYCLVGAISMWLMRPSSAIQPVLYLSKLDKLPCIKKI